METSVIIAYTICAVVASMLAFAYGRYAHKKKRHKLWQMGRGKNAPIARDGNMNRSE